MPTTEEAVKEGQTPYVPNPSTANNPASSVTEGQTQARPSGGDVLFATSGSAANGYLILFSANGKRVRAMFQEIPSALGESRSVNYNEVAIIRRKEPMPIYLSTGFREVSFGLKFGVKGGPRDAVDLFALFSLLRQTVYPREGAAIPPPAILNLGQWFTHYDYRVSSRSFVNLSGQDDPRGLRCIIKNYSVTPSEERVIDEATTASLVAAGIQAAPGQLIYVPNTIDVKVDVMVFSSRVWDLGDYAELVKRGEMTLPSFGIASTGTTETERLLPSGLSDLDYQPSENASGKRKSLSSFASSQRE